MAFAVMNSVPSTPEELPGVLAQVMLGMEVLQAQPGFRQARLYREEGGHELMLMVEWESREHFMAFRQTEAGRRQVAQGVQWHPKTSFFEVAAAHDPPSGHR